MRSCSSFEDPTRRCLPGLTPHSCGVCTVPGVKGLVRPGHVTSIILSLQV